MGYRIEAEFKMDEKFMLCEEEIKAKYLESGRKETVFKEFEIRRVVEQTEE